jgi:hypothetical protein
VTDSALLVEPAYFTHPEYARTLGPEVGELAALAGLTPDPEQQLLLDATFALNRHGMHEAFEVCIICARQNMKTGFLKMVALGKSFILDRKLIVWSAHEFGTAQEAFRDLTQMIESCPSLDRQVMKIHYGNGDEAIELRDDRRIKFKARTKTGGKGLTGDDVFLDEGFALQPVHMGALLPTLSAKPDPQVLYGSSAGYASSAVLRGVRDRGRTGDPRLVYMEFCAPENSCADEECDHSLKAVGCALDDIEQVRKANPALDRRITVEYIAAERRALTPAEFARERLGWWDDPAEVLETGIDPELWAQRTDRGSEPVDPVAFAVDVSPDRKTACIAVAGRRADGLSHVGVVASAKGTAWLVDRVAELVEKWKPCAVVIDGRSAAASLLPAFAEAKIDIEVTSASDMAQACGAFFDAVVEDRLRHLGKDALTAAVKAATTRPLGEGFAWNRRNPNREISQLVAVTLALHGFAVHGPTTTEVEPWGVFA